VIFFINNTKTNIKMIGVKLVKLKRKLVSFFLLNDSDILLIYLSPSLVYYTVLLLLMFSHSKLPNTFSY